MQGKRRRCGSPFAAVLEDHRDAERGQQDRSHDISRIASPLAPALEMALTRKHHFPDWPRLKLQNRQV